MKGQHCLKVWSKRQVVVALSSAESELYGAVKTASEAIGVRSLAEDLGEKVKINLHMDSTAALSLIQRRGLGKAKHISLQYLWLQEASRNEEFKTALLLKN